MRWFVEVSHVGDTAPAERYCLDAKAWQAALQETRKLRGDSGPLSKFSIELLDDGYRAVDPVQKIRYLVNQAPADAPLHVPALVNGSASARPSAAPVQPSVPPVATASAPAPTGTALAGATDVAKKPINPSSRPTSSSAPRVGGFVAPRPAPRAVSTSSAPGASAAVAVASAVVNAPVLGVAPVSNGAVAVAPAVAAVPAAAEASVPPAPVLPVVSVAKAPAAVSPDAALPSFQIVLSRQQDPTPDTPISYREFACAVAPGTARSAVEALLIDRLAAARDLLSTQPPGKLVQIAIFDHSFEQRPLRPPLGTLTWKDWRGNPVLAYPAFGEAAPPLSTSMPPAAHLAPAAAAAPGEAPAVDDAEPIPLAKPISNPPFPAAAPVAVDAPAAAIAAAPVVAAPVVAAAPVAADPVVAAPQVPVPAAVAAVPSSSATETGSRSRVLGRRRAGEDLISDLFDRMHELHFERDIPHGAEFALTALLEVVPCASAIVQVFDINTRQFVVVRARGDGLSHAVLVRTPDADPLIGEVMRRGRSRAYRTEGDVRFGNGRWSHAKQAPRQVLCGPVRQGGRYLGLIEIADPQGGAPFHETEINAIDYICEQFADFIASRPVVLEPDVVLAR